MLQLITGRAGTGKTEYVFSSIKKLVENGEKDILLITPEQFSFAAEKRLLTDLGESRVGCVSNTSFTRLSDEIKRRYGGDSLPVLTKGAKAVMMKKAIESVQDGLVLFKHNLTSVSFINSFIGVYDEMKSCRVSAEDIIRAGDTADKEILRYKLYDIAAVIGAYDSLIEGKYYDSASELTRLYERLLKLDYFNGSYVFIDGFAGFAAQEYKVLEVILKQAKCVYITFCTDALKDANEFDLFSYVNRNIGILGDVINKARIPSNAPIALKDAKRYTNPDLKRLEENLFSAVKKPQTGEPNGIRLFRANDISGECNNIALEISKLLRNGCRAEEIAVIVRDLNKYERELAFSFSKYGIPYFDDERQAISAQPLIMFVGFLLRVFIYSYRTEDIFSLLKTGMTALGFEEISKLENYAFLWSVNGAKWKKEFTESTKGFAEEITESDGTKLEALNSSREYLVSRLEAFRKKTKNKNAREISKALYYTLLDFSCDEKLKELAQGLVSSGKSALAEEQGRIWDLLMEILDKIAVTGGEEPISLKEYQKLFTLMITNEDLGSIPIGLDNVLLGSADRIRCANPRAVFIAGANEGEFPQIINSSGLLTETDRAELVNKDFKLYSYGEILNAQEKYFAYNAMCAPREKLYVSYVGESESVIVREIRDVFPGIKTEFDDGSVTLDKIESRDNAFELLAANYNDGSALVSSLEAYFENEPAYADRLNAVRNMLENAEMRLEDKGLSKSLFGKNLYLSASRIEDYYNCAFRYFCKFGLGAKPLRKAQLDPMQTGTVIHYVLEQIIKSKGREGLLLLDRGEVRLLVNSYLKEYLETKMGDSEQFTPRFRYQFMRLSNMLVSVVERLIAEFEQSDFEPRAFELKIGRGDKEEEIKSRILPLPDGGSIEIRGAVDRVDYFEENGKKYVRVVDYKSGNKSFELSDIIYGLNLQMFIYLFNVAESEGEYGGIPGGVLYMHSARPVIQVDRSSDTAAQIKAKEDSEFKMKGIILNDDENGLAEHMEHDLKGKYIPAKIASKGKGVTGNIASLSQLGKIAKKIDALVVNMGASLHSGAIARNPVNGAKHDKTCEYCDYRDVCMNSIQINCRELKDMKYDEVMKAITEESDA